jgi:hypothetical protein
MKKQTAVEWLALYIKGITNLNCDEVIDQALKMEKDQIYSEEDMKQFAWECVSNFLSNNVNEVEIALVEVIIDRNNKKFEQFKKK